MSDQSALKTHHSSLSKMSENILEETCLYWLEELGWNISPIGITLTPNPSPRGRGEYALDKDGTGLSQFERNAYSEVILVNRLRESLIAINPDVPAVGIDEAVRKILTTDSPDLLTNNRNFHRMLTDGIDVEIPADYSSLSNHNSSFRKVWLVDIETIENNDWLALNQLTVIEKSVAGQSEVNRPACAKQGAAGRRADVVLYLNGLPIAVLELKNPGDENATIKHAFNQLQTYKKDIPSLFTTNELLVISDGILARSGTLTSGWDRYMPWRTISGEEVAPKGTPELETLVRGLFERRYFLDYILNFVVFEDDLSARGAQAGGSKLIKKAAAYHQYWAVNKAVGCTLSACGIDGDPTKLIGRFPACAEFDAAGRPSEQDSLEVREDSPVYGKGTKHFDGKRIGVVWHTQGSGKSLSMTFYSGKVVRHPDMGNPTLVIITDRNDLDDQLFGTFVGCRDLLRQSPVQAGNRSHLRDLLRVASGGIVFSTIQKFMPSHLQDEEEKAPSPQPSPSGRGSNSPAEAPSPLTPLPEGEGDKHHYRGGFDFSGLVKRARELREKQTPSEEVFWQLVRNRKFAGLKFRRQHQIGDYIVDFYCHDARMVIELDGRVHNDRAKKDDVRDKQLSALGNIVLRLTNEEFESDPELVFQQIYNKLPSTSGRGGGGEGRQGRQMNVLSDRKNIVVIADEAHRSQYSFIDGFARHLHDALPNASFIGFTGTPIESDDRSTPAVFGNYIDKYDILRAVEDGATVPIYYESRLARIELSEALLSEIDPEFEHITEAEEESGKQKLKTKWAALEAMVGAEDRIKLVVRDLVAHFEKRLDTMDGKAMIVCMSRRICVDIYNALQIRDDVGFFQEIRAALVKTTGDERGRTPDEIDSAIKQLVSRAVAGAEVVDIFEAAGLDKPDISILSDEFLEEVKALPQKNLALEMLKKLINDEIKARSKKNVIQARSFAEMLELAVKKYQNRAIEAAEIIQELIELARELRKSEQRGDSLGLTDDELAFYDALADNGSAKDMIGDEKLRTIAQLLVDRVKRSVSIDWTLRENARAQIRVMVKRILRQYGYPPDLQKAATELVIEQAEVLCKEWSVE